MYADAWQKQCDKKPLTPLQAQIAAVVEWHPEYHADIAAGELDKDYTPEGGQTNPFLHMGMHIALREQAGADRPVGIKSIYQKLLDDKGQHEAEHAMMDCLGEALWTGQRNNQAPDEADYLDCLKKL